MKAEISPKDWGLLSAYLDKELSPREMIKVEQKLRASQELQDTLKEMQLTRSLIQSLPRKHTPRNFTLTPDMAAQKPSTPSQPSK